MRVAVYNQMFGLDGQSFWSNIIGHYYVHWKGDSKKVLKIAKVGESVNVIKRSDADIIGVCEVYEGQEKEICNRLRKKGYKYFYFGNGHRFEHNNKHVIEILASKLKCKQLNFGKWPMENKMGGGGGYVVCKLLKKNVTAIHIHLGMPSKKFFLEQIKHIQKVVKSLNGKIILMGDFNYGYDELKEYFPGFKLISSGEKSCSITPLFKWFYNKDVDHILVKGLVGLKNGSLEGKSDHKLIYADLRL